MAKPRKLPVEIRDEAYDLWDTMGYTFTEVADYFRGERRPLFDSQGRPAGVGGYDITPNDVRLYVQDEKVRRQANKDCEAVKAHKLPGVLEGLIKDITLHKLASEDIWRKLPEAEKKTARAYKMRKDAQNKSMDHLCRLMYVVMPERSTAPTEDAKRALAAKMRLVMEEEPTASAPESAPESDDDAD